MFAYLVNWGVIKIQTGIVVSLLAFFVGLFVFWKKAKEEHYDNEEVFDLVFSAVVWGMVFGRVFEVGLFWGEYGLDVLRWIFFWKYPGIDGVGVLTGMWYGALRYCRRNKQDFFRIVDLLVLGLAVARAVWFWGRFLGGATPSLQTNWVIGVVFPGTIEKRHPIDIYLMILWIVGFMILWILENKYRKFIWYQHAKGDARPGFVMMVFLMFLGFEYLIRAGLSPMGYRIMGVSVDWYLGMFFWITSVLGIFARSGLCGNFDWIKYLKIGKLKGKK